MGKGSQTTSTQSTSSADPQAAAAYRDLLTRASGVASTPYQAYTGDLTAPVNAQQQAGIGNINANANFASPYISQAAGLAGASAAPITSADIQQYLNPYTQNVVDATTQQMQHDNAQAMAGLQGNQIAQGALGGNATGVAKGILAGQQNRTDASTVAGLYSQGYGQALGAAQQQQQTGLAGANALANYGISGQNAALAGANAQIGAGSLEQQTQQANLNALYNQYQMAQAYPYQQTQWLAGIDTGVGSNLGGTSNGQTTGPAPNQTAQYLGAGISAAGLFLSDREAKEDIEHIGHTNDGQKIYRYRYKGSPHYHIGLIAQEAEKRDPENVSRGLDGMRYLDIKGATDDAVSRASGGGVGGTPWSGVQGWIPQMNISAGSGAPHASAPAAPSTQAPSVDYSKIASGISGFKPKLDWGGLGQAGLGNTSGEAWGGGSFMGGDAYGGSSANPLPGLDASDYGEGFARGGGVAGYADGGSPDLQSWLDDDGYNPIDAKVGPGTFADRFSPSQDAPLGEMTRGQGIALAGKNGTVARNMPDDVINPDNPVRMPDQAAVEAWRKSPGMGQRGPAAAPVAADDEEEEAPAAATPTSGRARPGLAGASLPGSNFPTPPSAPPIARPSDGSEPGFGLGLLSRNAQTGLLTAGLSMLASRSPFLGNAVGEGGLAGLSAYGAAQQHDQQAAAEAEKLRREAQNSEFTNKLALVKETEAERHNRATEENASDKAPSGYQRLADGTLGFIKGGPHDPEQITAETAARTKKGTELDDDTVDAIAQRVAQGDTRAVIGLGRNPAGIAQIQKRVAEIFKEQGLDHEAGAKQILSNIADQAGRMTAERTQAGIASKLAVYGRNVDNAIGVATKASEDVSRTGFVPVNKAINSWRTQTGDPKTVALGQALYTLINEYARAIGGGHGTVHDKEEAEQKLNQAYSHQQLVAIMNVMRQEIDMTKKSLPEARQEMHDLYARPSQGPGATPAAGSPAGGGAFTPPPGAIPRTFNGKIYYYDPNTKQPYPGQ
ncbi:MAG TPA: tail fiber domain-containing protein [Acetobacteraceae bacterium]|nr:tail fiber domain-containing protein [Acetobacteraceae bacterium]